jgi:hypothetical protein
MHWCHGKGSPRLRRVTRVVSQRSKRVLVVSLDLAMVGLVVYTL